MIHGQRDHHSLGLHCESHDPQADRAALEQLAEACDRFSPLVGLETSDEPECLLLDITGLGPLFGGEESLAGQVAQLCRQRGYRPHIAVADTVGAAWALAHFGIPAGKADTLVRRDHPADKSVRLTATCWRATK